MPLVYACICPTVLDLLTAAGRAHEAAAARTVEALGRVAEELASQRPETALVVSPPGPTRSANVGMGILTASHVEVGSAESGAGGGFAFDTDQELAERITHEARSHDVKVTPLRRWDAALDAACAVPLYYLRDALAEARLLVVTTSRLEPRFHFEFGKAVGRALAAHERRVALVCSAGLSHALVPGAPGGYDRAGRLFDEQYRRAIEGWDVKWLVHLERDFRRAAAEDAVPQTAVLMGALSGYRIQPGILSYEAPSGAGCLVAAIDVLGPRWKREGSITS